MTRIQPVDYDTADSVTGERFALVRKKLGITPKMIATTTESPAVAKAYIGFGQILATGTLPLRLREQIALLVGNTGGSVYCIAAPTVSGNAADLSEKGTRAAKRAISNDKKARIALDFARKVVEHCGVVDEREVEKVRKAGYSDGQIGEIVANIASKKLWPNSH